MTDPSKVTERTAGAQRLHQSYLSAIAENLPGLLWLKDKDGRFLTANLEFVKSCGLKDPALLVGKRDLDVWPRELALQYMADDARVMKSGQSCTVEEPISDQGVTKWFETVKTPISDEQGRVFGTIGYSRDITKRKQAQEALRESEAFNRELVENLPEYILIYGLDGNVLYLNTAGVKVLGYELERVVGTPILSYVAPEFRDFATAKLTARVTGGELEAYEMDVLDRDGRRVSVVTQGIPIQHLKRPAILLLLVDITERKQAEAALKQRYEELERYNKITVGRELRMIELKKEVNGLLKAAGQPEKYKIVGADL